MMILGLLVALCIVGAFWWTLVLGAGVSWALALMLACSAGFAIVAILAAACEEK